MLKQAKYVLKHVQRKKMELAVSLKKQVHHVPRARKDPLTLTKIPKNIAVKPRLVLKLRLKNAVKRKPLKKQTLKRKHLLKNNLTFLF